MSIFGKNIKVTLGKVILIFLFVILVVSVVSYLWIGDPSDMWGAFFGSLGAGMIVAIIQYLIAWQDYKQTEKLKELKLVEFLNNRRENEQYGEYIKSATGKIDVMGSTAVRLFRDFADTTKGAPESTKVLISALDKKIKIRILLPKEEYLINDGKRMDAKEVRAKYNELKKTYNNIEIKYFDHKAAHSIFRIDDTCIIGPIFPNIESRNTPALHVMSSSPMAVNYLDYYDLEWEKATPV